MSRSSCFSHSQLLLSPQIHSFNPRNNGALLHPHPHLHLPPFPRNNRRLTVTNPPPPLYSLRFSNPLLPPPPPPGNNNDGGSGGNNDNNGRGNGDPSEPPDGGGGGWSPLLFILLSILSKLESDWMNRHRHHVLLLLSSLLSCFLIPLSPALALADPSLGHGGGVWEVRGGKWTRLVPAADDADAFTVANRQHLQQPQNDDGNGDESGYGNKVYFQNAGLENCWRQCSDLFLNLMLPEGYPESVSSDYLEYSLWRGVQGIASQISGVLSTQALLYAVGLGKGAIPTAAAVNWVLKDGLGYLSKILLSKFGRHFDVNPKGWRLFADLMENAAYGLEIITPSLPQYFVLIGAAAGAGRSAAALIQAATRSCFFANFAVQRNSAEVIAKGEAQGMVSKFLGIMLGIALANYIGSSTPLALATFSVVTGVHMYCNLKSYQSIQLKTLNPYRASLVFSEYLLSGQVPPIKEVNDEEPLFPDLPHVNLDTHLGPSATLSVEAKNAAAEICRRLQLGYKFSQVVKNKEEAFALFDLFRNEGYMLTENRGRYCVILSEGCSPQDMLKSLFHVNYLYWLERNVGLEPKSITDECKPGGMLQISLDYVQREFGHIKQDGLQAGWLTDDGLIARPLPNRIRPVYADSNSTS